MDVTSVTSLGQTGSIAAPAPASDYMTFLRMLTAQMQNQDPLNPMDSADYAVQLATFSQVEQTTRTNDLLVGLSGQFALMGMTQLAAAVGQEARVAAPAWFSGSPVTLSPNPAVTADRAVLVVRDAGGTVVSREDVPLTSGPYDWFGGDIAGNPLPEGAYLLMLESMRDGEVIRADPVEYYGRVIEARGGGPLGTRLVLEGGIEVPAEDITALRVPPG
jgi:flagellar basal-body rod modification protein FlgD